MHRLGRWIDFENDYKTLDITYMESVWWVFGQLWTKGLVYKGFKVGALNCPTRVLVTIGTSLAEIFLIAPRKIVAVFVRIDSRESTLKYCNQNRKGECGCLLW